MITDQNLKSNHRKLKVQLKAVRRNWELKENKWEDEKGILIEELQGLKEQMRIMTGEKAVLKQENNNLQELCQSYKKSLSQQKNGDQSAVWKADASLKNRSSKTPEISYEPLVSLSSKSRSPRTQYTMEQEV